MTDHDMVILAEEFENLKDQLEVANFAIKYLGWISKKLKNRLNMAKDQIQKKMVKNLKKGMEYHMQKKIREHNEVIGFK